MANIKTATYLLPEDLLCYFHYGDESSLDDRHLEMVQNFVDDCVKAHGFFSILSDDEETRDFVTYHDLQGYGWPTDVCIEMTFHVEKE